MTSMWMQRLAATGLSVALLGGTTYALQQPAPAPPPAPAVRQFAPANPAAQVRPAQAPQTQQREAQPQVLRPAPAQAHADETQQPFHIGPIDKSQDLMETAKLVFKLADTNNDNKISQKEAVDAGNLLVGGFFFRADQNGDGTLSKEEAQAAEKSLLAQQPWLRFVLERASRPHAPGGDSSAAKSEIKPDDVVRAIGEWLDTNQDKKIEATELRQGVERVVKAMFESGDANHDGQLEPDEIMLLAGTVLKRGANAAFQLADTDHNGALSKEEFAKALEQPAYVVFDILDRNLDGQLTVEELDQAVQVIAQQITNLQVPTPTVSPLQVLGSSGPSSASR
jgi:Ca2+-binding EF-hand superfamily protein